MFTLQTYPQHARLLTKIQVYLCSHFASSTKDPDREVRFLENCGVYGPESIVGTKDRLVDVSQLFFFLCGS